MFDEHLGGLSRHAASCRSLKTVNLSPSLLIAIWLESRFGMKVSLFINTGNADTVYRLNCFLSSMIGTSR